MCGFWCLPDRSSLLAMSDFGGNKLPFDDGKCRSWF